MISYCFCQNYTDILESVPLMKHDVEICNLSERQLLHRLQMAHNKFLQWNKARGVAMQKTEQSQIAARSISCEVLKILKMLYLASVTNIPHMWLSLMIKPLYPNKQLEMAENGVFHRHINESVLAPSFFVIANGLCHDHIFDWYYWTPYNM